MESQSDYTTPLRWRFVTTLLFGILITIVLGKSFYSSYKLSQVYLPLQKGEMELRMAAMNAFIIPQDLTPENRKKSSELFFSHIRRANFIIHAIIEGKKVGEIKYHRIIDPEVLHYLVKIRKRFEYLEYLGKKIFAIEKGEGESPEQDEKTVQEYNFVFEALWNECLNLGKVNDGLISSEYKTSKASHIILIALIVVFLLIHGLTLYQYFQRVFFRGKKLKAAGMKLKSCLEEKSKLERTFASFQWYLQEIINTSEMALVGVDPMGNVTLANEEALSHFSASGEPLDGKDILSILSFKNDSDGNVIKSALTSSEKMSSSDIMLDLHSGEQQFTIITNPLLDEGEIKGLILYFKKS